MIIVLRPSNFCLSSILFHKYFDKDF